MLKKSLQACFLAMAFGPWVWFYCCSLFVGKDRAFQGMSQLCSLWPGVSGELFRAAFYRLALPKSSQDTALAFLTTFSNPDAQIGANVFCGVGCHFGKVAIGDECLVGSFVCITSGKKQHKFGSLHAPIRMQGGEKAAVTIGRNCWIGASSVILADIGEGSIIAAGSVVVNPIPEYSIAAGNPAKVIRSRKQHEDMPE